MRDSINCRMIDRMTDTELLTFMSTVHTTMKASELIQEDKWHGDAPKLDSLLTNRDFFQSAYNAAIYKDLQKVAAKKKARSKCIDTIKKIANNVELSFGTMTRKSPLWDFP